MGRPRTSLPVADSQEIVVRVTASFFEHFLHRRPAPILDRPTEFYPELSDLTP